MTGPADPEPGDRRVTVTWEDDPETIEAFRKRCRGVGLDGTDDADPAETHKRLRKLAAAGVLETREAGDDYLCWFWDTSDVVEAVHEDRLGRRFV